MHFPPSRVLQDTYELGAVKGSSTRSLDCATLALWDRPVSGASG